MTESVRVPAGLESVFSKAEKYVKKYFSNEVRDPSKGTIMINGERYLLIRASSMSVHFWEFIQTLYPGLESADAAKASSSILFDIAHAIGLADAISFHKKTKVEDPIAKLSCGPVHFAYTGWAFVDIDENCHPSSDDNFLFLYDHPQSFEADSWLDLGKKSDFCVCAMNAGYSSGWCEASFGIALVSREILCRAKGDVCCRFIMATPEKIDERIEKYQREHPELFT